MRTQTCLEGDEQVLRVSWRGNLTNEQIEKANRRYREGAGLEQFEGHWSGSREISKRVSMLGGNVKLERYEDTPYNLRNEVRLPISKS